LCKDMDRREGQQATCSSLVVSAYRKTLPEDTNPKQLSCSWAEASDRMKGEGIGVCQELKNGEHCGVVHMIHHLSFYVPEEELSYQSKSNLYTPAIAELCNR